MKFASNLGRSASTSSNSTAAKGLAQWGARRLAFLAALAIFSTAVHAQTNTWTAGSASDTNWDTTINWSRLLTPGASDDVVFPTPIPNPGSLGDPTTISLNAGELAKSLTFNASYTLMGGELTLGSAGSVNVAALQTATISSSLIGTSGLAKTGAGKLVLTGTNTYTGATTISAGVLSAAVRTGASSLGTGAINLNGATLELTPTADTSSNGLSARQFITNAQNDTQRIDFTQTANFTRVDGIINFPDNAQLPPSNAFQWIGKLNITTAGSYQFGTATDDGSRLFIDGVMVVQNDGGKGTMLGTSKFMDLSAGMHDIRLDYVNGVTGAAEILSYNGPDSGQSLQPIGPNALYTAESNTLAGSSNAVVVGTGVGNALNVTGNSTINLNGTAFTQVQVGNSSFASGSSLTLTTAAEGKSLRIGGTSSFGSAVTLNLLGDGTHGSNMYFDGVVSDGGVASRITKTGLGRLVFDQTTVANGLSAGSLFDIQAGTLSLVGSSAAGTFNPIGSAGIQLSGGGLVLDSKVGNATFTNAITMTQDASIQTLTNTSLTTLTSAVAVPAGKTLTLDAIAGGNPVSSAGATLFMSGGVSGTGNLNIISTNVGTLYTGNNTNTIFNPLRGNVAFGAGTAGFTGAVSVNGGSLQLNTPQTLANASSITLNNNAQLNLTFDGDGTGQRETFAYNYVPVVTGTSLTIGVNRSNTAVGPNFPLAANKTIQIPWTSNGLPLSVVNGAGYSLEVLGATTMAADQTYSVSTATASDVGAGLIQTGKISGAFNVIKQGAGVLVLNNAANDFGGSSNFIDIQGGVVAAATDSALGNATNGIHLNANGTANVGLRATGTFSTARTISFGQASNGIEVTSGKTLTITTPFDVPGGSLGLVKNDAGVLELAADNSQGNWSGSYSLGGALNGGLRINQGIVRVLNSGALGQSSNPVVVFNNTNAGLELAGGVNVPNPLTLNHLAANNYAAGINWGGALRSISGENTWSGAINENQDSGVSADAGATLNLTGGITFNAHIVVFGGAGNVNVTGGSLNTVHSLDKIGAGTTTIQSHVDGPTGNGIRVYAGNLTFSGNGEVSVGGTVQTILQPGGTLNLDNSVTQLNNRLGPRNIQFLGGNLNLIGGTAAGSSLVTETMATPTFNRGQSTVTLLPGAGGVTMNFTAASNSATPAQNGSPSGVTALFRGLGTSATGGVGTMAWTAGGLTFNGQTGATATTTKGLVPWALVDASSTGLGTSFATADSAATIGNSTTNPIRALLSTEYASGALAVNANMLVTTALTAQTTQAPNSLTIDTGGSIAMAAGQSLSLSSGGVLIRNGVTTTIGGAGIVSLPAGNSPWSVHTVGTAALTINAVMSGGSQADRVGLVKGDGGTMTLSTPTSTITGLSGLSANTLNLQTVVNQGKLVLNGGKNTLGANNYLEIGAGGTLDLNGTSQYVLGLFTDGVYNGIPNAVTSGGTLTNSGAAQSTFVTNSDARNFSGQITGNTFFNRTGTITATTLYVPQTYTGGTLVNGGTLSLRDYASLVSTPTIDINYAALTADNGQAANITDRINDAAQINLRGGTLTLQGRIQTDSTETVGAISVIEGVTVVDSIAGGTGINSAVLTAASLTRPAGSSGVVILGRGSSAIDQNGQIGSNPRMLVTAAPALTNNIIGPWAIIRRDWASNIPSLGIGQLNATGFAGYSTNTLTGSPLATDNIKITALGTTTTLAVDTTINTLNLTTTTTNSNSTIDLGGKKLTLAGGGMMFGLDGDNQLHTVSNGTLTSGYANGALNDLYVYQGAFGGTNRLLNISATIANNGATPVRLIVNSGDGAGNANRTILTGANTYSGGTVVNQGTLQVGANGMIPAGGISLNGGALTQAVGGVINPANVITLNGPSTVNFANNNTIAGLVFNNNGGGSNAHQVSSFTLGVGNNGLGTLTIGASGIVATSSNVAATSTLAGRADFGAAANTITVDPIMVNGVDINPLQAGLALQGVVGSTGGITKLGAGTLQLNSQDLFTGPLTVSAGGVSFGPLGNTGLAAGNAAGSRFSSTILAAGTRLNLNNTDATIGSLAGSGVVINVAAAGTVSAQGLATGRTFNVGYDNTNTTFSGQFLRYNDALPNPYQVQKIGSGVMSLTGTGSNMTGTLQISQGTVAYSGAGLGSFGTYLPVPNGTLTLDNSGTNVNNRLTNGVGTGSTLSVGGGTFRMIGNSGVATAETIGTLNISPGGNLYGNSTITLEANAAKPLTLTALAFGGINIGTSGLIRGISPTAGNGLSNLALGAAALNAPAGSGTGANGTTTMAIRPDILGDASITGLGTGFITKDSATNFLRPLTASELATSIASGANTGTVNYGINSATNLGSRTIVGSLTLNTGAAFAALPGVAVAPTARDSLPVGLVVSTGGILNFGAATIDVGRLETLNNLAFHFRNQGDLTVNSTLFNTNNGLNKGDAGTLTLGGRSLYTGQTQINLGKLVLNGGDNTLPLLVTGGAPGTTAIGVNAPGSTIDFNGTNQITGTLGNNQNDRFAGSGGIITNSSATPVTYTSISGSAQAFGGQITGNLGFTKTGNNALTLTNVNTYTGPTIIRANTLQLIDQGSLANTSSVTVNYAGLNIDQSGLNPLNNLNPTHLPAATPVTLRGSTLTLTSGGSADYSATLNSVSAVQSHSTIAVPQAPAGATSALNIGNLIVDRDATLNVTGGTGGTGFFNSAPGIGISNLYISSVNGIAIPAVITNKILPANIITNNGEFTTYVSPTTPGAAGQNYGIVTMNGIGAIAQTQYDSNIATLPGSNASSNVRLTTAGAVLLNSSSTFNVLALRAAGITLNMQGNTLNLASGGLALTNGTAVVGSFAGDGTLTAGDTQSSGVSPLYIHSTGAIVNSTITDN
ncbi:MAG: hypothetical protein JWN40_3017, partial [Phycisphaerales bacterium]|nr:hypothetical protein [Phycisphaerales bacterium]